MTIAFFSKFLSFVCIYMYVVYVNTCVCVCTCVCTRMPGVNIRYLLSLSTDFCETESLTEPQVHLLARLADQQVLEISLSLSTGTKITDVHLQAMLLCQQWGAKVRCSHLYSRHCMN